MDRVRRFIFEHGPVRGHWVGLTDAWRALREHGDYPPAVEELLGEAVVAAVLLAATLKFRGTLTLQLQGEGAVRLLVAQCTHDFRVRAVARFDRAALAVPSGAAERAARFATLAGHGGRVTVTVEAEEGKLRYQSVVPLSGSSLAQSLEAYFASSEQLPTRIQLAAGEGHAAGMLVQKLPEEGTGDPEEAAAAWRSAQNGISRLQGTGLLSGALEILLATAFPGRDLRVFRGSTVRFECRCSPARVASMLRALGADEVRDVLSEQGAVTVTCEFCHRPYRFDPIDVEALFSEARAAGDSAAIH
jgi:molecular chaperone Hsp33